MGDIGEVTASTLSADQDAIDMQAEETRKGMTEYSKMEAEIEGHKANAAKGQLADALEALLNLEKTQRLAEDIGGTRRACQAVLEVLRAAGDWAGLNEHILLLAKRRSQLKQAVQAFVRQAMGYIDEAQDEASRVELIKTLQSVTEGKIYVEIERARLTKRLAGIKEAAGNASEAADILQEVAVETFGAMAKTEKIHFILEQVRLCLARRDFVRAQILIRKVSARAFADRPDKKGEKAGEVGIEGTTIEQPEQGTPGLEELKVAYYSLYIRYHQHERNYLEVCRCLRAIYDTPSIQADAAKWRPVLERVCWYAVLAPADSEQTTLLNTTAADKRLEELPLHRALLQSFLTKEVVWWSTLSDKYAEEMRTQADIFDGEYGSKAQSDFRLRVTEHNVLVIAKYYSRIRTTRLAELLDMEPAEAEKHLSDMVVAGTVTAKIDRPSGVVRFESLRDADDILNEWSASIGRLLQKVEKATSKIDKESMVHRVPIGASS